MELFTLEQRILKEISITFEYPLQDVYVAYKKCCSFDKTIQVLDYCRGIDLNLKFVNDVIKLIDKEETKID